MLVGVWYLPPLHIHRIIFFVYQVRHLHKLIALILKRGDECIQRLCGVLRPVVAQDDGTVAQMLVVADRVYDGVHAVVLPVEGVHIPLNAVITQRGSGLDDLVGVIAVWRN